MMGLILRSVRPIVVVVQATAPMVTVVPPIIIGIQLIVVPLVIIGMQHHLPVSVIKFLQMEPAAHPRPVVLLGTVSVIIVVLQL